MIKYDSKSHIETPKDVLQFFHYLSIELNLLWHPDDEFTEGNYPMFTDDECNLLNRLMEESFIVCEKNNIDLYELGCDSICDGASVTTPIDGKHSVLATNGELDFSRMSFCAGWHRTITHDKVIYWSADCTWIFYKYDNDKSYAAVSTSHGIDWDYDVQHDFSNLFLDGATIPEFDTFQASFTL